ncbi:hypothetical protein U1Q18_039422 [Sarracenia purpurea var. burkii]
MKTNGSAPDEEQGKIKSSNLTLDKELRQRLQDSEHTLGLSMPLDEAKQRAAQLESEVTTLESGIEGAEGFRQRWSLHGRVTDSRFTFPIKIVKVKKDVSQEVRTSQAWVPRISPKEACCSSQGKRYGLSASWGIYLDAEKCASWGKFQKSVQCRLL